MEPFYATLKIEIKVNNNNNNNNLKTTTNLFRAPEDNQWAVRELQTRSDNSRR